MKKVLSFVLTMALVLTSFSMAFADTKPEDKGTKPAETSTRVPTKKQYQFVMISVS